MKARVLKVPKSMIARIGRDCIVLVNGRLLEGCKILTEDSSYLFVQFLQPVKAA